MSDPTEGENRRSFIRKSVVGLGTAFAVGQSGQASALEHKKATTAFAPSTQLLDREVGADQPAPASTPVGISKPASDLMVDVLRDLGLEYVVTNPGSSFEGLHESIINYGPKPNTMPELISAMHEEAAVDMAHGYARAEGKPIAALIQGTVGLQHASMAIYQAYHGRAPVVVLVGNDERNFIKEHSASDIAGLTRPFTKWDTEPQTLTETLAALQEAYRQAITPPCGPVVVVLRSDLQKGEASQVKPPIFRPTPVSTVTADAAKDVAKRLLAAENPRMLVGRLRTPAGVQQVIELAELVGASVDTYATRGPMSFPQTHHLVGPGDNTVYDFELGLERGSAGIAIVGPHLKDDHESRDATDIDFGWRKVKPNPAKFTGEFLSGDPQAALPLLLRAVLNNINDAQRQQIQRRTIRIIEANRASRQQAVHSAVEARLPGWEQSPISTARMYGELWPLIEDLDFCFASPANFSGRHHEVLWRNDKPYSYLGMYPAAGLGYCLGSSTGAALAAKARQRIVINIQGDGDFNYVPSSLWSAAHHKLPLLTIMHNNRAWHMEYMYLTHIAAQRGRGTDRTHIGTKLDNPNIDYAKLAAGYGVRAEGPISDPNLLAAAYKRGIEAVKSGEPYLIDVLTQPR